MFIAQQLDNAVERYGLYAALQGHAPEWLPLVAFSLNSGPDVRPISVNCAMQVAGESRLVVSVRAESLKRFRNEPSILWQL